MQAKLVAEEAERERLRLEKKAKKEKKKQELRERKIENLHTHHPDGADLKTSPVKEKMAKSPKTESGKFVPTRISRRRLLSSFVENINSLVIDMLRDLLR